MDRTIGSCDAVPHRAGPANRLTPPRRIVKVPNQMRPKAPTIEGSIVLALFDLSNQLGKVGEGLAARAGLTTQQWLVLLQVAGDPNFHVPGGRSSLPPQGVMASEIADARGVSRASISALVAQLLAKGLVRHEATTGDRRRKHLFITTEGRAALRRLEAARRRANRTLLAGVAPAARAGLLDGLRSCLAQVWQAIEAGRIDP